MSKNIKWTYELVKDIINKLGYELISDIYINMDKRLCFKDFEGYYYMMSFYNLYFQKNNPQKFQPSNPYTIQNIKLYIRLNNLDLQLIDEIYENNSKKLSFKDNQGYYYNISLNNLTSNPNTRVFDFHNPYTIQNIGLWCDLNKKPFKLLSKEYKGSGKKLKWQCLKEDCGEVFEANWADIISGCGCGYCAGQKIGLSNCLATKNPELAKQWHPIKNGDLTPYNITANSGQYIWWQCLENPKHEWYCELKARNSVNSGCPYCSGRYPSEDYNLLVNNPELCKEWDYSKNNKLPQDYTPGSSESVWWICKECGYEWTAIIHSRNSRGTGCPECNKSKGEKECQRIFDIFNIYYISQKEFDGLIGLGNGNLSYDFYLSNYNLLVEYQGEQHEKYIPGFHKSEWEFEKQVEHDKRKREYAHNHNINLLEIWYWDYDNIEEILVRELNLNDIKLAI